MYLQLSNWIRAIEDNSIEPVLLVITATGAACANVTLYCTIQGLDLSFQLQCSQLVAT